jgi:hypothetical protein
VRSRPLVVERDVPARVVGGRHLPPLRPGGILALLLFPWVGLQVRPVVRPPRPIHPGCRLGAQRPVRACCVAILPTTQCPATHALSTTFVFRWVGTGVVRFGVAASGIG